MSSSSSEVLCIKRYLEKQFITVSSEWVEACISFVKAEHSQNISLQNLKNSVYQQWLDADLEEIGACTFGSNCESLVTTQKVTLNGYFALQVDGIRDVGRPAYSQLKELEQVVNSNAEFSTAPPPTQPAWEAKPTRMLMLNLTDGCSHIQGMEYRPITSLSPNLPPGVKVLIQGPVDCRFGVLLLTPEKIKVLGGEVEEKLSLFSRRAILRQILQLPLDDGAVETITINNNSEADTLMSSANDTSSNETHNSRRQNQMSAPCSQSQNISLSRNSNRGIDIMEAFARSNRQNVNSSSQSIASSSRSQPALPAQPAAAQNQRNNFLLRNQEQSQTQMALDNLDVFEDDDFDLSVDHSILDELERESLSKSQGSVAAVEQDIWLVDEDVIQDAMIFQDEHPGFEMPYIPDDEPQSISAARIQMDKPFVYLSSVLKEPSLDCTVAIKGFIITVLSKLECTIDKGWNLMVRINDGSATLDVNIHDKVLEGIIGVSAPEMVKLQLQAVDNPEKRKGVMEAISRCKVTLQDYNCLMDVKFTPGSKPCLVKCYPVGQLNMQQLLERVKFGS